MGCFLRLTAWVLRVFKHAIYADWENILYIEPEIFERSINWIVKYQSPNGKFHETSVYLNPLDSKIRGNVSLILFIDLSIQPLYTITGNIWLPFTKKHN
jgi:hypothetical protein